MLTATRPEFQHMIAVLSTFKVANGLAEEVARAFRARPHLVDAAPGFVRLEVLRPHDEPAEFVLVTWWEAEEPFQTWYRSHAYKDVHAGMPPGLKLVPGSTSVRVFDQVAT